MLNLITKYSANILLKYVSIVAIIILSTGVINTSVFASGLLVVTGENAPPLRIVDHKVVASITDRVAYTTINQSFENTSNQRLEATYIFPIPQGADITDFQMTFNGNMVKGEVLPAEEARRVYESIVRQKRDPGLIEFIGQRLLRARIFPIEPHSTTEIQISYQQIIEPMSGMWRYHYPLRTPGTNSNIYGTLSFQIKLESKSPLKAVWSPTHDVEVVRDGDHKAIVAYEKSGASLDSDFMVLFDTDDQDVGLSLVSYRENEVDPGYFLLLLSPKQIWEDDFKVPQDYVFVVDTSGSMAGEKIDQARKSLTYCIDSLDETDRFSIVRFSTGHDLLFDELHSADKESKDAARESVKKYKASGGTNIFDALKTAIGLRDDASNRPFVVIFLTDGIGERKRDVIEQMLKEEIAGSKSNVRIFPFGVGHDVNTKLLDTLATGFGGAPTYVQPGENLEYVLGDFFSIFSQPVLTDLKLSLPDAVITDKFPPTPGDMYHGRQLILTGRYEKDTTGSITLKGKRGNKEILYQWNDMDMKSSDEAYYVASIWAGRKIAYLIDHIRLVGESDELVNEVVELSQKYGIQTPYSSWLIAPELGGRPMPATRVGNDMTLGVRREKAKGRLMSVAGEELQEAAPADGGFGEGSGFAEGGAAGRRGVEARDAIDADTGILANQVAQKQARLRDAESVDDSRQINEAILAMRTINKRTYFNIQGLLVDSEFTDKTKVMEIKFASDAYFDIVFNRPDLRPALAATHYGVFMIDKDNAIVIRDKTGIEKLDDEQRKFLWDK